jgi:uncharacterized protein
MTTEPSTLLRAFLADSARPPATLKYHELQGFLFAVASAPELIQPSEWIPAIFDGEEAGFASREEAEVAIRDITAVYNDINQSILDEQPMLPSDCAVADQPLDNFGADAPLACWARGFAVGHEWLEDLWDVDLPDDWSEELGGALMVLAFFSSEQLAETFRSELPGPESLQSLAQMMLDALPEAISAYAYVGRVLIPSLAGTGARHPSTSSSRRQ